MLLFDGCRQFVEVGFHIAVARGHHQIEKAVAVDIAKRQVAGARAHVQAPGDLQNALFHFEAEDQVAAAEQKFIAPVAVDISRHHVGVCRSYCRQFKQ